MKKKIFLLVTLCFTLITRPFVSVVSAEEPFDVSAKAALAIDASSGKVLYAKNTTSPMVLPLLPKSSQFI